MQDFYVETEPKYRQGILVRQVNGKIIMSVGRQYDNKEGITKTVAKFCQPEVKYQVYSDKAFPMGFTLGENAAEALEVLKKVGAYVAAAVKAEQDNNDIPF